MGGRTLGKGYRAPRPMPASVPQTSVRQLRPRCGVGRYLFKSVRGPASAHHVIARKAGAAAEPDDEERRARCAEPSPAPRGRELGAAPGVPNFGHRLWDPLAASRQASELLVFSSVGLSGQSQAWGTPVGCVPSCLTPDKKARGGPSASISSC